MKVHNFFRNQLGYFADIKEISLIEVTKYRGSLDIKSMNSNKRYNTIQEFAADFPKKKTSKAHLESVLDRAYDIRKFEIELYWKRAGYFWGFLVASFTAYFIVSDASKFQDSPQIEYLVLCIGFIFALSWYLVNRGSKYWQSNWEKIIDTIEDIVHSPLYRTNLTNSKKPSDLISRYPYSVSRINIIVSLYICLIWLGLIVNFFVKLEISKLDDSIVVFIILLSLLSIVTTYYLTVIGQSRKDSTEHYSLEQRYMEYNPNA